MKQVLFTVFEDGVKTHELLLLLKQDGFNGTIMGSSSVNHALRGEKKGAFFPLSEYAEGVREPNLTIFFLVEEERMLELRGKIKEATKDFQLINGCMFSLPVTSYEGSF